MIRANNAPLGTQLKLMLNLENGVRALFKPQWYSRDSVIHGPVYYGKDRHNAEVVAFHLSSLLALRRVPLAVIRKRTLKLSESVRLETGFIQVLMLKLHIYTYVYICCVNFL